MIKYPLLCTTYAAKMAFIERALRLIQDEHNIIGTWYKDGIDLSKYEKLRAKVQIEWPYTIEKLPKHERKRYLDTRFETKSRKLLEERGVLREMLYTSTRFSPNLDDDIS